MTDHGRLPEIVRALRWIDLPLGDIEDAAQEAELAALRRHDSQAHPVNNLQAWLIATARRIAFRMARARRTAELTEAFPAAGDLVEEVEQREIADAVWQAVATLPEHLRAVVIHCCMDGMNLTEAARICRVCPGTISRRLEKAFAVLRTDLVKRGIGPS